MRIRMKSILPKPLRTAQFLDEMQEEIENVGQEIRRDFGRTVETWNNKPSFQRELTVNTKEVKVEVFARHRGGGKTNELIYYFISEGTVIRYATMTDDFIPKTTPGLLDSQVGRGGLAYVDVQNPRPGIKARKFDVLVADEHRNELIRYLDRAISKGVRGSGHQYK